MKDIKYVYLAMKRYASPWPEDGGPEVTGVFTTSRSAERWNIENYDSDYMYWVDRWDLRKSYEEKR